MNASSHNIEFEVPSIAVKDVSLALVHTIFFNRFKGKLTINKENKMVVGPIDFDDVDCSSDCVDFTYVRISSNRLTREVDEAINLFVDSIKNTPNPKLVIEFTTKNIIRHRVIDSVFRCLAKPWEIWNVCFKVKRNPESSDKEIVREQLMNSVVRICNIVNSSAEFALTKLEDANSWSEYWDLSYEELSPYYFKIYGKLDEQ
ncbi:hypothetical protein ACOME3_003696 [Neoechinorhynchus agilis]